MTFKATVTVQTLRLEELEAELGPNDANVLELRAILEARTANPHGFPA